MRGRRADEMSVTPSRACAATRSVLRGGLLALALVVALLQPVGAAQAATPVPAPKTLPTAIEPFPDWEGAQLCDPVVHGGPKKLQALLTATYGTTSYGITRSCSGTAGTSEHNEGRALDWMISGKTQKAYANAFLTWLFATDSAGNTYAMARRMGIMYVVWDNRMFRLYDVDRGWTEYDGCLSRLSASDDTDCHRNHVHFSFTWDGAGSATSYWSGRAVTAPDCAQAPSAAAAPSTSTAGLEFVPLPATRILDTAAGVGVSSRCRLSQGYDDSYARRLDLQVTGQGGVPTTGVAAVALALQVDGPTAPTRLVVSPTGSSTLLRATSTGMKVDGLGSVVVPLGTGGRVSLALRTGSADLTADVLGYYKVADGSGQRFHPLDPRRVLNTSATHTMLEPGETREFPVAGLGGVPATGATAVTYALTIYDPPTSGGVTVYDPDDAAPPEGRLSLTSPAGGRRTNVLVSGLSSTGTLVVRNDGTGPRDVAIDVQGWWAPASVAGGSLYRLLGPTAVVDTGKAVGLTGPLQGKRTVTVTLAGVGKVPASGVTAVALQTTVLVPTASTALVAWRAGLAKPQVRTASPNGKRDHTAFVVAPLAGGKAAFQLTDGNAGLRAYAVGYWYQ